MSRYLGERDTIAAIATAAGPAAVGIVRISGPATKAVLEQVVGGDLEPRRLTLREARAGSEMVDEVLAVWMPGPRSFTGEDSGELHGHGGAVGLARLLRAVVAAGARHAEPGEFTRRAFENGRLDLTQAEGLLNAISAASERAHRLGLGLMRGDLGAAVRALRDRVVAMLAVIEAAIDFPEDEPAADLHAAHAGELAALDRSLAALLATAAAGTAVCEGVSVALVGGVNAGKSSLFNCLVGRERSIVAPEPGTTRDYVEANVVWDGLAITLIDTAGERDSATGVESRGLELGRERAGFADLQLVIAPATEPAPAVSERQLLVRSKVDLGAVSGESGLATSAVAGTGVDELRRAIRGYFVGEASSANEEPVVVSERQREQLALARSACERARSLLVDRRPPELAAVELREARAALSSVLGEEVGDEMLDALFARFCIGK